MSDDYEVGFGKPPKETQFKKGTSGNLNGRPRARTGADTEVIGLLTEHVPVKSAGCTTTMDPFEAGLRKLAQNAMHKLKDAINFVEFCEKYRALSVEKNAKQTSGVLIIPRAWDHDEWMAMLHKYGAPPWPGKRSGLIEGPPSYSIPHPCGVGRLIVTRQEAKDAEAKKKAREKLRPRTRASAVAAVAHEMHEVTVAGKNERLSTVELALLTIRNHMLQGNSSALKKFSEILDRYQPSASDGRRGFLLIPETGTDEEVEREIEESQKQWREQASN